MNAPRQRQAGLTLVELMVALTIGLFIALALGAIFVNAKSTFVAQDRLASLHDNERLAVAVLTAGVQLAGYFPDPAARTAAEALPAAGTAQSTVQFVDGQGMAGKSGTGGASDTLAVRFVSASGDGLLNCQGSVNTSGSNQLVTNLYSISANNELQCAVNGNAPVPLVSNVSAMAVLYGTDSTASGNIDKYLPASAVTTGALWGRVKSLQVTLTFASQFNGSGTGAGASTATTWVQNIGVMGAL